MAKKKNVELLKKVMAFMQKHPRNYDQNQFGISDESCGTRCCIAGTAVMLNDPIEYQEMIKREGGWRFSAAPMFVRARKLLGLSLLEAQALFSSGERWPHPFDSRYQNACSGKARARIGIARIKYFLKTGK